MKQVKLIKFQLILLILMMLAVDVKSQNKIQIKSTIDSLVISDTSLKSKAIQFYTIKEIDGLILCYIKPFSKNVIYQFNYVNDKWQQFSIINLPDTYLEFSDYGEVKSFDIINRDSLLIFQDNRISIFNTVKKTSEYNYLINEMNSIILRDYSGVKWDKWSRKILITILRYDDVKNRKYESDSEFGALLNPLNDSLEILPLKYPDVYKTSLKFSMNSHTGLCVNESYIIGFSGITPDLVVYDKRSKLVRTIPVKHINQNDIELIDTAKIYDSKYMMNHVVKNTWYRQFYYDAQLKIYYRIYMLPVDKTDYDIDLSVVYKFENKMFGIIIMNEQFEVLDDVVLENGFLDNWSATSKGLMVLKYRYTNPKGLFVQTFHFQ